MRPIIEWTAAELGAAILNLLAFVGTLAAVWMMLHGVGAIIEAGINRRKRVGRRKENIMIKLGDKVRDTVTGFEGIAIGRTEWLNGCIRWTVQSAAGADGKLPDANGFDEPQLEVVQAAAFKPVRHFEPGDTDVKAAAQRLTAAVGGPFPEPAQAREPRR